MVQPRPKTDHPTRLKRPLHAYIRALRKAGFVRAAIAELARRRAEDPGQERRAALWLPVWVRQMALDGTPLPKPDIREYRRRGLVTKSR